MNGALGPLDIVELSREKIKRLPKPVDTKAVAKCIEAIVQKAVRLVKDNAGRDFLYKKPNAWRRKKMNSEPDAFNDPLSGTYNRMPCENFVLHLEPWALIKNFKYDLVVHQIKEFIETWELTPATKFVILTKEHKIEHVPPYGDIYFAEAHFSKPTPKCPNPLAVAKVYFYIHVSHLLPSDYPVNVTYKFEGYKSKFRTFGEHKIVPNTFQNYFISSILHMKLAFYAKLCECRNPISAVKSRKKSTASGDLLRN